MRWVIGAAAAGEGHVVDLLLGLRRRQELVPHALDRYLSVEDVVRGTICGGGQNSQVKSSNIKIWGAIQYSLEKYLEKYHEKCHEKYHKSTVKKPFSSTFKTFPIQ